MTFIANVPEGAGYGFPIVVTGTIYPGTNFVRVGLSASPTVPPSSWTQVTGEKWSVALPIPTGGLIYVWAEEFTTEGQVAGNLASLRWSDTRGRSWQDALTQSLGNNGQFLTSVQWRRLGLARDRVFELSWTLDALTALNGAFVDVDQSVS
jgi:hypothetical protein